jgi:hypothetical protein
MRLYPDKRRKSRARGCVTGNIPRVPSYPASVPRPGFRIYYGASSRPRLEYLPVARQGVRNAVQQPLVLTPLLVSLPLRLPCFLLGSPGFLLLRRFLFGGGLPLLRPALGFEVLVADQGAGGFLHLALGLILNIPPSTALSGTFTIGSQRSSRP